MITFDVELPEPIDARRSLAPLARAGDDHIDDWDGKRLLRTVRTSQNAIPFRCDVQPGLVRSLIVSTEREKDVDVVHRAVSRLFLPAPSDFTRLVATDPIIADLDRTLPGVRPVLQHDLFTALVRGISAQQVNLAWAATTRGRLAVDFGDRHELDGEEIYSLDPRRLAKVSPDQIRALQFTNRKAETIVAVAREFADDNLSIEVIRQLSDEGVIARLVQIKGIGPWSAEWVLCRTLGRPCVVAGDLGVRKVVGTAYNGGNLPSEDEVRILTAHWGDSATIAQALLLHGYT